MATSRVSRRRSGFARAGSFALYAAIAYGCGGMAGGPSTGGESHFLNYCEASCEAGLDCISGVCTRGCLVEESSCGDLASGARCTDASIEPGTVAVCDVACAADTACSEIGAGYRCRDGFCRRGEPGGAEAGSCRVLHRSYASGTSDISAPANRNCDTCSCLDGELECPVPAIAGWCLAGTPIVRCPDPITSNRFQITGSYISGDSLTLDVSHDGDCAVHDYALCYSDEILDTAPETVAIRLSHDAHDDSCNAVRNERLRFDLRPLARYVTGVDAAALSMERSLDIGFGLYTFGRLLCADRSALASTQIAAAVEAADKVCSVNSDCRLVSIDTACSASCGAIASSTGAADIENAVANIDAAICRSGGLDDGCGPPSLPPCVPPPRVDCVEGVCVFAP